MTLLKTSWRRAAGFGVLALVLDILTKQIVLHSMALGESIRITPFFYFTYVYNTGSAFGLFEDSNKALLLASFLILALLLYSAPSFIEQAGRWGEAGVGLVVGGAVGNMIDRIHYGYVIDFLDFRVWPVFNAADSAISVGTALLAFGLLRK